MSKIVIDAREYSTSSGRYVKKLLEYLARTKSEHEYVVLFKQKDFNSVQFDNPHFSKALCDIKEFTFAEQITLLRQIKALRPDLVHFPFVQQPILYRGRVVTTIQDLTTIRFKNPSKNPVVFAAKQQVYKLVNYVAAHKSCLLITISEFVRQDAAHYLHVSPAKFTVTLESADAIPDNPEPVSQLVNPDGSVQQFIMYIGRPTPHKNLSRLIKAYAQLRLQHPDLKLVLAGKKDTLYAGHEAEAARQGITGIVFTDFVSEGQLKWLYQHTACYVFPSLSEGFGLPGLEAMIHGAPVASSNATCLPEVHGDAARYFDPLDVSDMAHAIDDVISNPQLANELIQKGKAQVAKFSWQRMAEQTLEVYNKALTL